MSEPLKGGFGGFAPFKPPGSTGTPPSSNVFGNTAATSNTGTNAQTTATPNASGGGASGSTNLFGNIGGKPLFGAGAAGTAPTAGNAFAGFGGNRSTNTNAQNASAAPAAVSTPPPGGGLFAAKPAEQSTNTNTTVATPTPQTSAPPLLGGFGGTTTANTTTSTSTPAAANMFGRPVEKNTSTTAPATGASTGASLFAGGNLFGKKPDTPTPVAMNTNANGTSTGTTPTAPLVFGLGAKKDDNADKDKQKEGTSTPTTAPSGGQFGQTPANKDASTASSGSAFNMFGQKPMEGEKRDGTAPAATSSSGATPSDKPSGTGTPNPPAISVPPPSMLRGKTIEEIVNKWTSELETHVREFNRLAGEIAVWDRALIDNGNTIAALLQHVMMAEREQSDIEQSLKHVEDQQKELASTLEVYEKAAGEIFDAQGSGLRALDVGPADAERDKHYSLAAELNTNLDDLSRSLLQMIESVNTLSEPESNDGEGAKIRDDAPLEQIAQILSSHLESLQWIDSAVKEVEGKVTDVERLVRDASVSGSRGTSGTGSLTGSVNGARSSGLRGSRGFGLR